MVKAVYTTVNRRKNKELVSVIKSGLSHLKNENEEMSISGIEIEKPNKVVDIFERILELNRQNQEGQGVKILTPDQMISRLPIVSSTKSNR